MTLKCNELLGMVSQCLHLTVEIKYSSLLLFLLLAWYMLFQIGDCFYYFLHY